MQEKQGWGAQWTTDFMTVHYFADGRSLCGRAQGYPGIDNEIADVAEQLACRRCVQLAAKRGLSSVHNVTVEVEKEKA
jgi:hypothetical protein